RVALFGAAYSGDRSLLRLLGQAVEGNSPEQAMLAVGLLSQLDDAAASGYLQRAMLSPYPPIRLEACHGLARRGEDAAPHLAALLHYGEPVQMAACHLLAQSDTPRNNALMQRLMVDSNLRVRAAAIWSCGTHQRDDFLPLIRQTVTH